MSHTAKGTCQIKTGKSAEAIVRATAEKIGAQFLPWGKHRLYSTTETGFGISMPGWQYPVVINEEGLAYDNYNGRWGKPELLTGLKNRLTAEHVKKLMKLQGHAPTESVAADGTIKITTEMGG